MEGVERAAIGLPIGAVFFVNSITIPTYVSRCFNSCGVCPAFERFYAKYVVSFFVKIVTL